MSSSAGTSREVRPVRPLTTADAARVARIERALFGRSAWSEPVIRAELDAPGRWYVGVDGDEPDPGDVGAADVGAVDAGAVDAARTSRCVAYAGLWFDGDVAQVMTIGVVPSAQGRGLGALLLEALVARARDLGAASVLLEVRVDNEPAMALYRRFGFTVLGRRKRYYQPEDVDAWTMELPLPLTHA